MLVLGYGLLLGFWRYGSYPAGVRGLFDYRSATWGDGLLLPLLALCLCALIAGLPRVPKRWPTVAAVLVGAGAGGLVILSWVTDPAPALNWTMPAPHRLNTAGVGHAIFLVGASGLFTGLWIELMRRLRHANRKQATASLRSSATAGAVAGTTGYAWLATVDSSRAAGTAAGRGSLIALGVAALVLMVCLVWVARGALRAGVSSVVTGLLLAAVVLLSAEVHGEADALVYWALFGALFAGLALASAPGHHGSVSIQELLAVPALFVGLTLAVVAVGDMPLKYALLAPLVAAVLGSALLRLICGRERWRDRSGLTVEYLGAAGISTSLLIACVFGLWQSAQGKAAITGGFLLTIVGAVLGGMFLPFFKTDFEDLMRIEGDPAKRQLDGRPSQEQSKAAAEAWPRLIGYAVSAFVSMLVLTIALADSLGWQTGHAGLDWPPGWLTGLIATILVAVAAPAVGALRQSLLPHPANAPLRPPNGARGPAWCCCGAAIAAGALFILWLHVGEVRLQPLAIAQALLIALFAMQSMLGNGVWLHLGRVPLAAAAAVGAGSLAVLVGVYWSLTTAVRPHGAPASAGAAVTGWFLALVVVATLVVLTASAIYVAGGRPYLTDYAPAMNVGQDVFHLMLLWFVVGWIPQFVLANVPASSPERWSSIGTILAGFLLLFGPAFLWILENNDTHVERQRGIKEVPAVGALDRLRNATSSTARIRTLPIRIVELADSLGHPSADPSTPGRSREFLVRLSGHTAIQNTVALALATLSVVGAVGVGGGLTPNATGVATLPTSTEPRPGKSEPETDE